MQCSTDLSSRVLLLEHEVSRRDGGAPAVAHVAGDEDQPTAHAQSALHEVRALLEEVCDGGGGQVLGKQQVKQQQ